MQSLRIVLTWLAFPFGLVVVALGLKLTGVDSGTSASDYSVQALDQDKKLLRTIEDFGRDNRPGAGYPLVSLADHPGMRIDLMLDEEQIEHLARTSGWSQKRKGKEFHFAIAFDGGPTHPARFKVHGESSLEHPSGRKSLSVDLFDARIWTGETMLSSFFLIGLQFDPYEYEMLFSYRLLAEQGLFHCYFAPVVVYINGEPQGIYLLVEKPVEAIVRQFPETVSVYRRAGKSTLTQKYERSAPESQLDVIRLNGATENKSPDEAGPALKELLDLEQYDVLLAFNSLVRNGDPADEVFFYEYRPVSKMARPFNVMAWDFDDVMEDAIAERKPIKDELLYAAITSLDKRIHENDVLYNQFREVMRERIESIWTPEHLTRVLEEVRVTMNAIDTGLPEEVQVLENAERNRATEQFREELLERREYLLNVLEKPFR